MVQNLRPAAYIGRESVRINVLKCCPRLAQAVNGSCAWASFVIMAQISFMFLSIRLRKMASASNESHKENDLAKKWVWSAAEEKQLLTIWGDIEITEQLDNFVT